MIDVEVKKIEPLFKKYGVQSAGIFGSYSRGENRKDSDIDLLVKFAAPIGYFDFVGLQDELSSTLGREVDLVTEGALSPYIKDRVLADLKPIYGQR